MSITIKYASTYCLGHRIENYYCAAKCLDCGWGGCDCFMTHCCCQFQIDDTDESSESDTLESDSSVTD